MRLKIPNAWDRLMDPAIRVEEAKRKQTIAALGAISNSKPDVAREVFDGLAASKVIEARRMAATMISTVIIDRDAFGVPPLEDQIDPTLYSLLNDEDEGVRKIADIFRSVRYNETPSPLKTSRELS
jgi:hypothetical protein